MVWKHSIRLHKGTGESPLRREPEPHSVSLSAQDRIGGELIDKLPADDMVHDTHVVSNDEKRNMKKTIKGLISDFSPENYLNNRREKLLDIIQRKIKKKTGVEAPEMELEENTEGMTDLMSALKKKYAKGGE